MSVENLPLIPGYTDFFTHTHTNEFLYLYYV
jgi:hypothetical protein